MHLSQDPSKATFKHDTIYTQVFSQNPDLRLIAQWYIVDPQYYIKDRYRAFDVHMVQFGRTHSIFRPFLNFPELFPLPFPDGDSPLDFLADPRRAGNLYLEPSDIAEDMVLHWITRTKRTLAGGRWTSSP
jgi:hypothetical protein